MMASWPTAKAAATAVTAAWMVEVGMAVAWAVAVACR